MVKVQKTDEVIRQFLGEDGVWYVVVRQENWNTYTIEEEKYINLRNKL